MNLFIIRNILWIFLNIFFFFLFDISYEYIRFIFFYSENSWDEVVNNRLLREMGKRNFYLRFNNWFIFSLGKVYFVVIERNKNK